LANIGRLVVFGCGGLVALVVLIVVVGALIGGSNQETAVEENKEQGGGEKVQEEAPQQEQASYGLNETVQVGDAAWIVTNAQKTNELADPFGVRPAKQGTFVIIDFQFQNGGNEAKTLHQQALQLVDSSGRESDPDPDDLLYVPQDRNILMQQVNPGVTQPGQVIFTIAPDASDLKLILKDTNLFRSEQNQAEVDLGL
jgi:hypothetical protein